MIPIGEGREGRFLIIFLLQYLPLSGLLAYHEVTAVDAAAIATMLAILTGMTAIAFVSGINTIVLVEGGDMLAERYLKRRLREGIEIGREEGLVKGREEGLVKGRAEGRTEGRDEANQKWEAWNQRRMDAEKAGLPFNEPPPSQNGRRNGRPQD